MLETINEFNSDVCCCHGLSDAAMERWGRIKKFLEESCQLPTTGNKSKPEDITPNHCPYKRCDYFNKHKSCFKNCSYYNSASDAIASLCRAAEDDKLTDETVGMMARDIVKYYRKQQHT